MRQSPVAGIHAAAGTPVDLAVGRKRHEFMRLNFSNRPSELIEEGMARLKPRRRARARAAAERAALREGRVGTAALTHPRSTRELTHAAGTPTRKAWPMSPFRRTGSGIALRAGNAESGITTWFMKK